MGISGFAITQLKGEQERANITDSAWNASLQARTLAQAIEHAVVEANSIYTADDVNEAKLRFTALQHALAAIESARGPFLVAMQPRQSKEALLQLDLAVKQFSAYQQDTAELGLKVSLKAALIQATDEATIKNREQMVTRINQLGADVLGQLEEQREASRVAAQRALLALTLLPTLALAFGTLGAIWLMRSRIEHPLRALKTTMQDLASDQLEVAVPFTTRYDEVGEMARSITAFQSALLTKRDLDRTANQRRQHDLHRASTLASATRSFESAAAGAVSHLTEAAQDMNTAANRLTQNASETAARAQSVAAAAEQSASAVVSVARAADELSTSALQITERVRTSSEIARDALKDTRMLETGASNLAQAAHAIGAVGTLIRDVAHQTGLLALNATIEAARAGEAGKGFAVVAYEVKALATQTARATEEINRHVSAIQDASDQTTTSIDGIGQTISQMNRIAQEIAESAAQQGLASEEIARAITIAADQVKTVSEGIDAVQRAVGTNEAQAEHLRMTSRSVNESAFALHASIEGFLGQVEAA